MKLLTYKQNGTEYIGVLSPEGEAIYPLSEFGIDFSTMSQLIQSITEEQMSTLAVRIEQGCEKAVSLSAIEKMAPVPQPAHHVICVGLTYLDHVEEVARYNGEKFTGALPDPVFFFKRADPANYDGGVIPAGTQFGGTLDYGVELAVILKNNIKDINVNDAMKYVFGYTIINDVSMRGLIAERKRPYFAKSLDGFCPMGPWIVTADEFDEPPVLSIRSRVNGELRQDSSTYMMIFSIPYIISELSKVMTLEAGTIIATGTPSGTGCGFTPPKFLKPGDIIECEIGKIGCLTNMVGK